ncbi:hypothetical protein NDU88_005920 [Pleurodeles waltl]|uniref:Uncharacterized protein n=1 Tax=Pleurodeles waltl TaxID=8319 RepID=A0AAV7LYP0_PLEWA|nr:hypothetical protein NDU88_005920 [Pleurodeles waltl]
MRDTSVAGRCRQPSTRDLEASRVEQVTQRIECAIFLDALGSSVNHSPEVPQRASPDCHATRYYTVGYRLCHMDIKALSAEPYTEGVVTALSQEAGGLSQKEGGDGQTRFL